MKVEIFLEDNGFTRDFVEALVENGYVVEKHPSSQDKKFCNVIFSGPDNNIKILNDRYEVMDIQQ